MVYSHLKYSDKAFMGSVTAPERAADSVALANIVFGDELTDPLTGRPKTTIINLINVNSPMTYDATMLGAAKVYARANQALIITPFILAGAMSPVTVAGTVAQTFAEALAGLAFVQLVNPGAPVVLGSFASSISMQSGAPTFGTPEPALVLYSMAALARRLGIPFRSGGSLCASKIPDAQAAYESANTLLPTCLAGVNFVLHTAGWLEGGLAMGYEKFVMDVDQAGMMHTLLAGVDLSPNGQALDAMHEVGPGKHFLGCAHTQANFENAFYRSPLADNNSYEQWEAEGSPDMTKRANTLWKKQLAEYVLPPMDPAIDEALLEYMAKRKAASPTRTSDFSNRARYWPFGGGGGAIMAPSQCSSALPSLKRHMSNHEVVYFAAGSLGEGSSRGVTTITKSPSATTATILVAIFCGTGDGLRMEVKNFTTGSRPEATFGLCW